jgi:hypothetical protein
MTHTDTRRSPAATVAATASTLTLLVVLAFALLWLYGSEKR